MSALSGTSGTVIDRRRGRFGKCTDNDQVRRNITQRPFTIFGRNLCRSAGLYRLERRGIGMPICFMPGRSSGTDKDEDTAPHVAPGTHPEWREPPGYLGEAVRRAKRIASLSRNTEPPITQD